MIRSKPLIKLSRGNFDDYMKLSVNAIEEIHWWVTSLPTAYNKVSPGGPDIVINMPLCLGGEVY